MTIRNGQNASVLAVAHAHRFVFTLLIVAFSIGRVPHSAAQTASPAPFPFPAGVITVDPATGPRSANDVFAAMGMSVPWDERGWWGSSQRGVHFAGLVQDRVLSLFNRAGDFRFLPVLDLPACEVFIRTMNFGAPEITELAIELKRMGVGRVTVIAHGPAGFTLRQGVERSSHRASNLRPKDGSMGQASELLNSNGFRLNPADDSPYQLLVTEVPRASGVQPLMHEKGVTAVLRAKVDGPGLFGALSGLVRRTAHFRLPSLTGSPYAPIFDQTTGEGVLTMFMTDNFTPRPEDTEEADRGRGTGRPPNAPMVVNRIFEITHRPFLLQDLAHVRALARAIRETGKISEIAHERNRLDEREAHVFADGSVLQISYTNGRSMPNERMIAIQNRGARGDQSFTIEEVVDSHYVASHDGWLESLHELMRASPRTSYFGIFDPSFISTRGPGLAATLGGFVARGDETMHAPLPLEIREERVRAYAYRRVRADVNARGKKLHHDKTTIYLVRENGVLWAHIFTGSLNKSDRSPNAEWQIYLRVAANSDVARFFVDSIKSQVRRQPDLYMPMQEAAMASVLGQFLGASPGDVFAPDVEAFLEALSRNNFGAVRSLAQDLYNRSDRTTVRRRDRSGEWIDEPRVAEGEVQVRLNALNAFLEWYRERVTATARGYAANGSAIGLIGAGLSRALHRLLDQTTTSRGTMAPSQLAAVMDLIIDMRNAQAAPRRRGGPSQGALANRARARLFHAMPYSLSPDEKLNLAFELYRETQKVLNLGEEDESAFKQALRSELSIAPEAVVEPDSDSAVLNCSDYFQTRRRRR